MSEEKGNGAVEGMWGCGSHHLPHRHKTLTPAISRLNLKKQWRGTKRVKSAVDGDHSAIEPSFNFYALPISAAYGPVLLQQQQHETGWYRAQRGERGHTIRTTGQNNLTFDNNNNNNIR